ncbi:hypothetical protein A6302_01693 [Methylobrevis pamukkalensis]|uniref:Uncharacterized protein n=2 Tax=Methylobrevis pamukkalensis TaxID=1439726 RepID=A0A1E3H3V3_9HYPH|nr:hypothetical protein A6302_01693 [Methylobrevis pamukkalensis]
MEADPWREQFLAAFDAFIPGERVAGKPAVTRPETAGRDAAAGDDAPAGHADALLPGRG